MYLSGEKFLKNSWFQLILLIETQCAEYNEKSRQVEMIQVIRIESNSGKENFLKRIL